MLQKLGETIKALIQLLATSISSIVNFIINIPKSVSGIIKGLAILPEKFVGAAIVTVSILVLLQILGRNH